MKRLLLRRSKGSASRLRRAGGMLGLIAGLSLGQAVAAEGPGGGTEKAETKKALAEGAAPLTVRLAPGAHKLTLQAAWRLAEQHHPTLQAGREVVAAAHYVHDEQKFLALPSGDFGAFMTWSPDVKCKTGTDPMDPVLPNGQPLLGGAKRCIETTGSGSLLDDDFRRYLPLYGVLLRMNANVYQPLFTFGKLHANRGIGATSVTQAEAQTQIAQADLAVNLVRAYSGIKAARAALETVRDGQEQIVRWIEQIDKELETGKSAYTEIDLLRMKVAEAQVQIGRVDLERLLSTALAGLRFVAQDPEADVDDGELAVLRPEVADLNYYLEAAVKSRPELKQAYATFESARLTKRLRIADFLPDFGIQGNLAYGLATSIDDPQHAFMNRANFLTAQVGLALRMSLDFGPKAARMQKALAEARLQQHRLAEALGSGALEIERAYNDLVEARQRLDATEQAEKRARGWLQGIKQAMDIGAAESRDMLDALRAYYDQHLNALRAINDVNVQTAVLYRLCGLPVIPTS